MSIVVFDIETIRKPIPPEYKQAVRDGKLKVDNVTKEPLKIWEKMKDKFWCQPEGAQPVAIALAEIDLAKRVVNEPVGYQSGDESKMANFFMDALAGMRVTHLIGYNSTNFDFEIILRLISLTPKALTRGIGKWEHIDLIYDVPKFFSVNRPLKGAVHSTAKLFNLPHKEDGTTGKEVADIWETDQKNGTHKVLEYCKEDVILTGNLFLHLSKIKKYIS